MEPPHLPSHQEDQVPLWGQRQRRQEDEVQNHCTTLVFRFHLALPHADTEGARGKGNAAFSCQHGPSSTGRTHGRSSPSSYSQMLQSCPRTENVASASSSTERKRPGVNTHLNLMKSWSGVYKRRSWMRGIGNSEWDMIQHKCYAVLKGLVARSYRILCDLTSVACQHPLSLGFLK